MLFKVTMDIQASDADEAQAVMTEINTRMQDARDSGDFPKGADANFEEFSLRVIDQ